MLPTASSNHLVGLRPHVPINRLHYRGAGRTTTGNTSASKEKATTGRSLQGRGYTSVTAG